MQPILLIHGYGREGARDDLQEITSIYGTLVADLRRELPGLISEIDLSRYVTLNDAVSIMDISRSLDRTLREDFPHLLQEGFNCIAKSTGSLVVRNWIKVFSPKPSPVANLIHLAGANFGSGWATLKPGQFARWVLSFFDHGAEPGVKLLQSVEPGSDLTLRLHLHFIQDGNRMLEEYQVQEYVVVGTQAPSEWFKLPVRYAKEEGSDGIVRVSSANLNFNYLSIIPEPETFALPWADAQSAIRNVHQHQPIPSYYRIDKISQLGLNSRPEIPFAIAFHCAHFGAKYGIISGTETKAQVHHLIKLALSVPPRSPQEWSKMVHLFSEQTEITYQKALTLGESSFDLGGGPQNQYDAYAQIIVRLHDQDGEPIPVDCCEIFYKSEQQRPDTVTFESLIEDAVVNSVSPNVITYYVRVSRFNSAKQDWEFVLGEIANFILEITAFEPNAAHDDPIVAYVPLSIPNAKDVMINFIQPHRTTVIDVELVRIPRSRIYQIVSS
jgi:hypothetical protein